MGEKLVFAGSDESTGEKLMTRETYSDITPTSFTNVLEMGPVNGPMKKVLTVKYIKQADSAVQTDACASAATQIEMNDCTAAEYRKADAHLNRVYSKLISSMNSDEKSAQQLKAAELAWIQYRDLHCAAAKNQFEGGSMAPTVWANCMTTATDHRIEGLKEAYETHDFTLE